MEIDGSNDKIEELTLEMFMNKKDFKKYKNNKLEKEICFDLDFECHKHDIQKIFTELLDDPSKKIHPDVKEQFLNFCKATINHLQNEEIFDSNPFVSEDNEESVKQLQTENIHSYWGKEIVLKKEEN